QYWDALSRLGVDCENRILVDKQPFNTVRLPLIARLFPDAKIIFCLRDPRDVVLSCFRRRFTANAANAEFLSLDGAAQLYDRVMRLASVYGDRLPLAVHPIRNEDLVADFDAQMLALCDFAGIEWSGNFREFAERSAARHVATPSAPQILKGLGRDGIGHWRKYESDLAPVLPLLSGWAERFGYDKA
ncbi:MAG TPA: sulfotransferase, partial [Rhizomicrobium sp.]|nr:sulfotransferase [Rhizomicrobium sp.]